MFQAASFDPSYHTGMILHLDLDCFFVSAERTRNPFLIGKPVAVGGRGDPFIFDPEPARQKRLVHLNEGAFVPSLYASDGHGNAIDYFREGRRIRGIVTTASYEARAFGVKTAMSIHEALRLCPQIILVRPDHLLYHTLSHRLHALLQNEAPLVEQYSIDEFFLDVRGWIDDAELLPYMRHLQTRIDNELNLPVSIGAAPSKWIAKLMTSAAKPHGLRLVTAGELPAAVADTPIGDFPGVGSAFSKKFERYRIRTVGQALEAKTLLQSWGRHGRDLYARLEGSDGEGVHPFRSRKSIGISRSMDHPVVSRTELFRRIRVMARHLTHTILRLDAQPTTYHFAIGYEHHLRSHKQVTHYRLFNETFFQALAHETFRELDVYPALPVRYLGISASKFVQNSPAALDLLHFQEDAKARELDLQVRKMRDKYGMDILRGAEELMHTPQ